MALTNPVTSQETYNQYLKEIGALPTKKLERCFACGLPAVWLYLKALGLEELFFDLLVKCKTRRELYKELFYLLILTNGQNKFFPHIPEEFLNIQIPEEVADAQIELDEPIFQIAYSFTKEQLARTLEQIAKPNVMIRLGNQRKAIGLMYTDGVYHVYHADNPRALEFNNIDGCVSLIMRVINESG